MKKKRKKKKRGGGKQLIFSNSALRLEQALPISCEALFISSFRISLRCYYC